jgi:hypothetical protein
VNKACGEHAPGFNDGKDWCEKELIGENVAEGRNLP